MDHPITSPDINHTASGVPINTNYIYGSSKTIGIFGRYLFPCYLITSNDINNTASSYGKGNSHGNINSNNNSNSRYG